MKKITLLAISFIFTLDGFSQADSLLGRYREMALEYNHDLKAAGKNISISVELEKSARADFKPKFGGEANFQYTGNPAELTLKLPSAGSPLQFRGTDMQYGASLSLSQPLYTGGRILETIRLAQLQQSLAISHADLVYSVVCYQTDVQYWNTVARHEVVGITKDFCKSMTALVEVISQRVDAGLVDPQDLLMAEVKLNEAKYQLLQVENNFEIGRMAFNSLIGMSLGNSTEIETTVPVVAVRDSLLRQDGTNRPELRMAQDQVKIAESNMLLNDSRYKPQLYVGVEGSYSSPGYNFKSDLDLNYAAYAKLSVPIFEWGKRRSEKRASAGQVGMAADNLNKTTDRVALEVQTAKVSLLQAANQVKLTGNSLEKAGENETKAMERYREGKISVLEVIDAQVYRQTAQLNYIEAKVTAQYCYSDLIKSLNSNEDQ